MEKAIRILLIEDSAADAELMLRALHKGGYEPQVERVETAAELTAALARPQTWDVVIADYVLPSFNGMDALLLLQKSGLDLPFIIVSGTIGEDIAVAAMKAGAHDYLIKGKLSRLVPAIEREMRENQVRKERLQAQEQLHKLSQAVEQNPTAILITNLEGKIEYANSYFTKMTGYTAEEILGRVPWVMQEDRQSPEIYQELWRTIRAGRSYHTELLNKCKNGKPYWEYISLSSIKNDRGEITNYIIVKEDITSRKEAEEKNQRQLQHILALRTIDLAITSNLDLKITLNMLVDEICQNLKVDAATVMIYHPDQDCFTFAAGSGFRREQIKSLELHLEKSTFTRDLYQKHPVHIHDLSTIKDDLLLKRIEGENFTTYHIFPLVAKNQTKGLLEIFHRGSFTSGDNWMEFVESLAEQAAIAIDNTTLFNDLQASNRDLAQAYEATLVGWSRALDLRDKETEGHTQRVTDLSLRLAKYMGFHPEELVHVRRGGLLHDIGKMGIPDNILFKPGPLTAEEWEIMRRHPQYAYELISPIDYLRPTLEIPYCHHEKWDGSGYPRGLTGEEIPLAARIFAIVDVWDALNSDRPYRLAWPREKILQHIREQSGIHFDPQVVDAFLNIIEKTAS